MTVIAGILAATACSSPGPTPTATPLATPTPTFQPAIATPAPGEGSTVGKLAYDFSVVSTADGQRVTRGSLRADGKPYILYFFATW